MAEAMASVETKGKGFKKVMRGLDMTLFTVCAVLVIDTLAASVAIGASSISWWLITLVLFFIPYGLITAELGTAYPQQGGLYIWVKKAFGEKWAARTIWMYWISVTLWVPAVFVLFAGMFAQLFAPELGLWGQILIGVAMSWVTVWIGVKTLETSKWVPNIGAIFKALIMVVIGVAAFIYVGQHGVANDLSFASILPSWDAGLFFLPVIVYNFMGFELMSGAGDEIKDPGRDLPRSIIISGVLITFFYLLGTIGMLLAVPVENLGLVEGIIDTLRVLIGDSGFGGFVVTVLGIGALYSFLANTVTWTTGANKAATEAAEEGELPAFFGRLHPVNKSPVGAFVLTGIISTVVIVVYGFMAGTKEELFWTLFAFSTMALLLPYLALFPAFLRLRHIDPDRERPYRVPGGKGLAWVMVVICMIFIVQAIVFFIWVPGEPIDWAYALPVLIGLLITIVVGEALVLAAGRQKA